MKPAAFDYFRPASLDEALSLLAEHGDEARPLAGGQSLIPMMALRLARPTVVVDLGGLEELRGIELRDGTLHVGSMVPQRAAETSAEVARSCPLLAQALPLVGHRPIRTRGTVGGSVAHADPAAELPGVVSATDAEIVLRSVRGERSLRATELYVGHFTTALEPDELVVEIRFPAAGPGTGSAFREVSRRQGDFAIVAAAATLRRAGDGSIAAGTLTLSGVGPAPFRAIAAERMLVGQAPSAHLFEEVAAAAAAELDPPSDLHGTAEYRRHLARTLGARVLDEAATASGEPR